MPCLKNSRKTNKLCYNIALGRPDERCLFSAKEMKGGKSGLHRAECQLTAGRCKPTTSATESRPPFNLLNGKGERVG